MMHIDKMAGERDVRAALGKGYAFRIAAGMDCAQASVGRSRIAGDR